MTEIIPAILSKNFSELRDKLSRVVGLVDTVQVDICDGKFAPNKTWPYIGDSGEFEKMKTEQEGFPFWDRFNFEMDLMVANPAQSIADFVHAGASRVFVHIESIEPDALSDLIHEWKHAVEVGLALKPSTSLSLLEPFLHEVSSVQCMGNDKISFGGVTLDERIVERVADLRRRYPELAISVDIGVNRDTAPRLNDAGATRLVMGSAIFESENIADTIEQFKSL